MFTGAITALYLVFIELTYGATSPGVRNDVFGIATLSAVWAAFIIVNWLLTLGRAPRGVRRDVDSLVVRDSYGRLVRFPSPSSSDVTVLQRYPAGWLASEPTELVRLTSPGGPSGTYLVARDLLKPVPA